MKKFIRRVGFAVKGLSYAFKTQLNFRIQVSAALIVIALGFYLKYQHCRMALDNTLHCPCTGNGII
jgi:diacylglycerol kinase